MELNPLLSNLIAVIAIVAGLALGAWWIVGLYSVNGRKVEEEPTTRTHEVSTGVPPVLTIFYVFIGLSLVLYVLYVWLGGVSY